MLTYEAEIRRFITETFLFGEEKPIRIDESLRDSGTIDSTGVLELISFLEETFLLKVEDDELTPENLDTIGGICAYLGRKKTG